MPGNGVSIVASKCIHPVGGIGTSANALSVEVRNKKCLPNAKCTSYFAWNLLILLCIRM